MSKKGPLGRGLGALINDAKYHTVDVEEAVSTGSIAEIDVNLIEENPFQPRKEFKEEQLIELAESIKLYGIISPITVIKLENDRFRLISGERRLRACKIVGLEKIFAFIREANDEQMLEMAIVENIQREDLNSIEIALSYQRLIDECGITQEKVSEKVGKQRSTVTNYIKLLTLPAEIQAEIISGAISFAHARALSKITDHNQTLEIFTKILEGGLSVRDTENLINSYKQTPQSTNTVMKTANLPTNYENFRQNIKKHFPAKVEIKRNNMGKGSLVITFRSDKELEEIISTLKKIE